MGADVIEPDIVVTKDGVLIACHDVTLSQSTDIASHPEFAARKRAGENGDGEPVAADWFVADFTLAEIKALGATSPNHVAAQNYNRLFVVATFQEILDFIKQKMKETGRMVAVYPEMKNPAYYLAFWKAGEIPARMEVADAHQAGLFVHEYTFRNERGYNLPLDAAGDPVAEHLTTFASLTQSSAIRPTSRSRRARST